MTIKAIETKYKGYRFRSRLEARWAVFFDALSVKWDYEIEGYELGDGTHYLPDFRIGGFPIEVKPVVTDCSNGWMARLPESDFRDLLSIKELSEKFNYAFIIFGSPFPGEYWIWSEGTECYPGPMVFGVGRKEDRDLWVASEFESHAMCIYSPQDAANDERYPATNQNYSRKLAIAYDSARSARFEHGENG